MKPTWEGWPAVYAAQEADVTSTSDCLYSGRWGEHDDLTWGEWQTSYEFLGQYYPPIQWDHCVNNVEESMEMVTRLGLYSAGSKLWHSTDTRPDEPIETIWYPVEYPN